jgi:NADH-quinone oxidoreductase subunit M
VNLASDAHLLQLAIATPLGAALVIALGLPKRYSTKLAGVAFAVPALIALWLWKDSRRRGRRELCLHKHHRHRPGRLRHQPEARAQRHLAADVPARGLVGLAAGLYALRSGAERLKLYLMLLLVMQGGLLGVFASVDVFFFYFFHELALIPTFIMVGVWGGRDRSYAAMKMTIYLTSAPCFR